MGKLLLYKQQFFYLIVFLLSIFLLLVNFGSQLPLSSNNPSQTYLKGEVMEITEEETVEQNGKTNPFQKVRINFTEDGQIKEVNLTHGGEKMITEDQKLEKGEQIILAKLEASSSPQYLIWDSYRLNNTFLILALFFFLVLFISGKKSFGSLLGLAFSFLVIIKFIIPLIMQGVDPLLVSIVGSLIILSVSIYLAHGLNEQTTVAVVSTFFSLVLTGLLAVFFVKLASLSGLGSEDAYNLQFRFSETINFQGLLLGGIIIGALGVLDDVTTTQSATIYELSKTDKNLQFKDLIKKGMNVGREHIASLVNTLVLAYAGASIGVFIFILLGVQSDGVPLWIILNSELLTEEIVRTVAGSMGLVLAVPTTTLLASFLSKHEIKIK